MMTNAHRDRHPAPTRQRLQPPPRFSRHRAELHREALEDLEMFTAAGRLDMARETRAHLRMIKTMPPAAVRDLWIRTAGFRESEVERLEALEMREALEALEEG